MCLKFNLQEQYPEEDTIANMVYEISTQVKNCSDENDRVYDEPQHSPHWTNTAEEMLLKQRARFRLET